jgi:hypothetical protein
MLGQIEVIRCPHCKEFVNARSELCRFCHGYIDTLTTQRSAEEQQKVNEACNEAMLVRNAAWVYAIFTGLYVLLPLFANFFGVAALLMLATVPLMLIRWQLRYGRLQTDDPDYPKAKRNRNVALLIWLGVPFACLLLALLLWLI